MKKSFQLTGLFNHNNPDNPVDRTVVKESIFRPNYLQEWTLKTIWNRFLLLVKAQKGPITSFESLIIDKIAKENKDVKKRKKISNNTEEILTRDCLLQLKKQSVEKKNVPKGKFVEQDSESEIETEVEEIEHEISSSSDTDQILTLKHLVENE